VHVFQARARQLDRDGVDTGIEVLRRVRVVVDSPSNGVPLARLQLFPFKAPVTPCMTVELDGRRSVDQGPNATLDLLYRWVQVAGPRVTLSNPYSAVVTFVVPDFLDDAPRQYAFQLFVDDGADRSEPDAIKIVAGSSNQRTASLPLGPGPNLIGLPVSPAGPTRFQVADLLDLTRAAFAVSLGTAPGSVEPRFRVLHPRVAGTDAPVAGNQGFLVIGRESSSGERSISGNRWSADSSQCQLSRGLNLIAYPRGLPDSETSEQLRQRAGAAFVVRTAPGPTGRNVYQIYLPPLTPAFPIEDGRAYLLSVPRTTRLTLPGCQ
jgi:hypothetical protein